METPKGANARDIGPMTVAVAAELRAALARKKYSVNRLAAESGMAKSTLHKTLNAHRAIDVEDIFAICDWLDIDPAEIISAAERVARQDIKANANDVAVVDAHVEESTGSVHQLFPDNVGGFLDDAIHKQGLDTAAGEDETQAPEDE